MNNFILDVLKKKKYDTTVFALVIIEALKWHTFDIQ